MYDLSYDFVLNGLDDFTLEKNHPGVGRGPARLKLFNSTHPKVEEAEGSGSAIGGPWLPRHPPPWITAVPPCVRRRGAGASLHQKIWRKKGGIFFLKPKIAEYKVLPNGVFIPHF